MTMLSLWYERKSDERDITRRGLVAFWDCSGVVGELTLTDVVGGFDGTILNADGEVVWADGKGTIILDGVDEVVSCGQGIADDVEDGLSCDLWIKPSDLIGDQTLLSRTKNSDDGWRFRLDGDDLELMTSSDGVETLFYLTSADFLTTTDIHHVGVVYTSTGPAVTFYHNGSPVAGAAGNIATSLNISATAFNIAGYANISEAYAGRIYRARFYNVVLSDAEILNNYLAEVGRIP